MVMHDPHNHVQVNQLRPPNTSDYQRCWKERLPLKLGWYVRHLHFVVQRLTLTDHAAAHMLLNSCFLVHELMNVIYVGPSCILTALRL